MKDLFTWLLLNLSDCVDVKSATMFNKTYSSVTIVSEDGEYNINIVKNSDGVTNDI